MTNLVSSTYTNHLRNGHPHIIVPYMSIIKPTQLYCGQVSGSPEFGARTITVTNVSGNIIDVESGMTVYVGSAEGSKSKGKRRLRSRVGNALTLDENTVNWVAGDYITIVDAREFWGVYPYITPTEPYVFYKDRDIVYTDQNRYPTPVVIMGGHKVGFLDAATKVFQLNGSQSYAIAPGATITNYAWSCTGGIIANASAATTTLTLSTAGVYWLKLTVTDSNGKSQSSWRIVRLHNRTSDQPFYNFNLTAPLTQDWEAGGWRTSIECYDSFKKSDYPDDAIAILWGKQTFNGVEAYYEDNVRLSGYLRRVQFTKTFNTSPVSADIETIDALMRNSHMFSVSLEYSNNPKKWHKYYKLTVPRVLHHYWKWHSTLFDITDVFLPMEETTEIPASDDLEAGNLYEQARNLSYSRSFFANILIDKHNRVRIDRDVNMLGTTARDGNPTLYSLTSADHLPEVEVVLNTEEKLGHIIVAGGRRNANDNTLKPIISQAPGEIPLYRGAEKNSIEYLVIASQDAGNVLAGRALALVDRYIEEVRIKLAGNYHDILEIQPQYWIELYDATNSREVSLLGRYTIKSISTEQSTQNGTSMSEIILIPDVESIDGIPGPYPEDVEVENNNTGSGNTENPPWTPPPPLPPSLTDGVSNAYVSTAGDVKATAIFEQISPTWNEKLSSVDGIILETCAAVWDATHNVVFAITAEAVWKTENFQDFVPTWEKIYDPTTESSISGKTVMLSKIITPPFASGVYVIGGVIEGDSGNAYFFKSSDGGASWTAVLIDEGPIASKPYTLTVKPFLIQQATTNPPEYPPVDNIIEHGNLRTEETPISPYGWGYCITSRPADLWLKVQTVTYDNSISTSGMADIWYLNVPGDYYCTANNALSASQLAQTDLWWIDCFGEGYRKIAWPSGISNNASDTQIHIENYHGPGTAIGFTYVLWPIPSLTGLPLSMDCEKTVGLKVYIGFDTKILRSIDGGATWELYIEDGANDIECHKVQSSGDDITYWSTDGHLYRTIGNEKGSARYLESVAASVTHRISSDPINGMPIYALAQSSAEDYMLLEIGENTVHTLVMSVPGGRSLKVTPGTSVDTRQIFYLTADDIRYSDNSGDTFVSKLGNFSGYASPVRIEPLE